MKVLSVCDYEALQVTTNEDEWPDYRRYHADAWEQCMGGDWCEIEGEDLEAAYQEFLQGESSDPVVELEHNAQRPLFYRRCGPGVWEANSPMRIRKELYRHFDGVPVYFMQGIHAGWERVKDPALLAKLERTYMSSRPEEATESTLKGPGQRYTDDFEWEADPANEMAQMSEALAYLAGVGLVLYPTWDWIAFDTTYQSPAYFQRDLRGLKLRQWRGQGFSVRGLLTNGGKWGVILVISEEELVRLWHKSPEQKLAFAEQVTRETIEHACLTMEGEAYREFMPTITEDSEGAGQNEQPA